MNKIHRDLPILITYSLKSLFPKGANAIKDKFGTPYEENPDFEKCIQYVCHKANTYAENRLAVN